jgi:hypothetical protein
MALCERGSRVELGPSSRQAPESPWKITVRSGAKRHPEDASRTRAQRALLTVIFARRHNAQREEDGQAPVPAVIPAGECVFRMP